MKRFCWKPQRSLQFIIGNRFHTFLLLKHRGFPCRKPKNGRCQGEKNLPNSIGGSIIRFQNFNSDIPRTLWEWEKIKGSVDCPPPWAQWESFSTRDAISLSTWIADSGDNVIISFSIFQLDRHLDTRPTVVDALTPFSSLAIGGINGEMKMCS
ncbi:hypothetical protein CEXT_32481 [Caerostris extrusa]|uniref:Uncharacterized protein n=1 Tax=Caerostris extrusa TaxID=172846 RepID=A0AAV4MT88_CAEEX|nr:hypothetical protein CEXT_32481 [Caerostris extrusa]